MTTGLKPLSGKVAVVAGATRGAGRGTAIELGAAGAVVYCTGRSLRGKPSPMNAPETLEETVELVQEHGGIGIAVAVDHTVPNQVETLFDRVMTDHAGFDIVANSISGHYYPWDLPFWEQDVVEAVESMFGACRAHVVTNHFAARFMVGAASGLMVSIVDNDAYGTAYYGMEKAAINKMAVRMAEDLKPHDVAVVSLHPGSMRTEFRLRELGVTEGNWQDAIGMERTWADSESPRYTGRAIVALASDSSVMRKSGLVIPVGDLAREYGFTDTDGRQP